MSQTKRWKSVAIDYNSPFFRNYIWVHCSYKYPTHLGISPFLVGIVGRKNTIQYVADMVSWEQCHNELKAKALKNYKYVLKLVDKANTFGEEFNAWSLKNIHNANLSACSAKELFELWNIFIDKQSALYTYGTTLSVLDFQGFSFVEGNLQKFLKEHGMHKYDEYYRVFTHPAHNSFSLDQEEDLLHLMGEFYSVPFWKNDVMVLSLDEIKKKYPSFFSKLQLHTKKHCWVYYVYMGPAFTEQHFFDFVKDYLTKGVDPAKKLAELANEKKEIERLKKQYITELKPDAFHHFILEMAGIIVWAKPRRKDYQSKSYYHVEKLLQEIGNRLSLTLDEMRSISPALLEKALLDGHIDHKAIQEIFQLHVCLPQDGKIVVLTGKEAETFCEEHIQEEEKVEVAKTDHLKGACACAGIAKGTVKIINVPSEMKKMNQGDILVSTATTPSIVPVMKMAAAIVTNEGGLTCHAAIVSRELQIPCVVGTKIATRVLKDGDLVEVDATKGVITILKRKV